MIPIDRNRERFLALFAFGVIALLPPLLLVFNRPVRVLGIPLLYLHIFLVWAFLIAAAARLVRRINPHDLAQGTEPEAETREARPPDA